MSLSFCVRIQKNLHACWRFLVAQPGRFFVLFNAIYCFIIHYISSVWYQAMEKQVILKRSKLPKKFQ